MSGYNFAAAEPNRARFHVETIRDDTQSEIIKNYYVNKLPDVALVLEQLSMKGTNVSLKLDVNVKHKIDILQEDFWPDGVTLRRFKFRVGGFLRNGRIPFQEIAPAGR